MILEENHCGTVSISKAASSRPPPDLRQTPRTKRTRHAQACSAVECNVTITMLYCAVHLPFTSMITNAMMPMLDKNKFMMADFIYHSIKQNVDDRRTRKLNENDVSLTGSGVQRQALFCVLRSTAHITCTVQVARRKVQVR